MKRAAKIMKNIDASLGSIFGINWTVYFLGIMYINWELTTIVVLCGTKTAVANILLISEQNILFYDMNITALLVHVIRIIRETYDNPQHP